MRKNATETLQSSPESVQIATLWGMSIPLMIEIGAGFLLPITDMVFAKMISPIAAVAIGAIFPLLGVLNFIFGGLATALSTLASQKIGNGQKHEALQYLNIGFIIFLFMVPIVAFLFYGFPENSLEMVGINGELKQVALQYFIIIGPLYGVIGLRIYFHFINITFGKSGANMISAIVYLLMNVLLNTLIVEDVFGLSYLGVAGLAVTSMISTIVSVIALYVYQRLNIKIKILPKVENLKASFVYLKSIMKIGMPNILEPFVIHVGVIITQYQIASLGDAALSMRVIGLQVFTFCLVPSLSMLIAMQTFCSQMVGRRDYEGASQLLKAVIYRNLMIMLVVWAVILWMSKSIFGLFDIGLIDVALMVLLPLAAAEPFRVMTLNFGGKLRACGDGQYVIWLCAGVTGGFLVPVVWWAVNYASVFVVLWMFFIEECLKCLGVYWRWRSGHWKRLSQELC